MSSNFTFSKKKNTIIILLEILSAIHPTLASAVDYFVSERPFFTNDYTYARARDARITERERARARDADGAAIITGLMRER